MSRHATGTFEVKSWDEQTYAELEGGGGEMVAGATTSTTLDYDVE